MKKTLSLWRPQLMSTLNPALNPPAARSLTRAVVYIRLRPARRRRVRAIVCQNQAGDARLTAAGSDEWTTPRGFCEGWGGEAADGLKRRRAGCWLGCSSLPPSVGPPLWLPSRRPACWCTGGPVWRERGGLWAGSKQHACSWAFDEATIGGSFGHLGGSDIAGFAGSAK